MLRHFLAAAVLLVPAAAAADPTELGAFFGPRIFSQHSLLGYIDGAPYHPMLQNSIELGARAGKQFGFPWLFPEVELAFSPTHTNAIGGAPETTVYWFEPRAQIRFELLPGRRLQPFLVAGGGAPIALSTARKTIESGVTGDGYFGGGVRFDTQRGFVVRFDARVALLPGIDSTTMDNKLSAELDIGFGVELALGAPKKPAVEVTQPAEVADRDGDGIPDAEDKCPDRPEDKDGFEDSDGCPDIDNDGDHVLDIADKCPTVPETPNGYEDDDGCPDTVPDDVASLKGTVEGLLYAEGETAVRDSAQGSIKKIAAIMNAHPSIKVILIGHTDDREAKAFMTAPAPGQPAPDLASVSTDLARARAEAVRQSLVAAGIPAARVVIDGVGAEEPVADNNTTKGRLANRRVEIKLYIPRG